MEGEEKTTEILPLCRCKSYFCSPRWLDWLRGKLVEDSWAHVQLLIFSGLSLAVVLGEYVALRDSVPGFARWLLGLV